MILIDNNMVISCISYRTQRNLECKEYFTLKSVDKCKINFT